MDVRDSPVVEVELDKKTEKELRWEGREYRNMIIDSDVESDAAAADVSNKIISISPYSQLDLSKLSISGQKKIKKYIEEAEDSDSGGTSGTTNQIIGRRRL